MASSNAMGEGAELLGWLNGLVDGRYTSLASCADCVAYAQLLAAALPQCATRHLHYVVLDESEQRENCAFLASLLREAGVHPPCDLSRLSLVSSDEQIPWLRDFLEAGAVHSQELGAGGNLIGYLRQIDFRKDREEQMHAERKEIAARLLRMRQQANVVRQRSLSQEDETRGAELGSWVQLSHINRVLEAAVPPSSLESWRLPSIAELESLVQISKQKLAEAIALAPTRAAVHPNSLDELRREVEAARRRLAEATQRCSLSPQQLEKIHPSSPLLSAASCRSDLTAPLPSERVRAMDEAHFVSTLINLNARCSVPHSEATRCANGVGRLHSEGSEDRLLNGPMKYAALCDGCTPSEASSSPLPLNRLARGTPSSSGGCSLSAASAPPSLYEAAKPMSLEQRQQAFDDLCSHATIPSFPGGVAIASPRVVDGDEWVEQPTAILQFSRRETTNLNLLPVGEGGLQVGESMESSLLGTYCAQPCACGVALEEGRGEGFTCLPHERAGALRDTHGMREAWGVRNGDETTVARDVHAEGGIALGEPCGEREACGRKGRRDMVASHLEREGRAAPYGCELAMSLANGERESQKGSHGVGEVRRIAHEEGWSAPRAERGSEPHGSEEFSGAPYGTPRKFGSHNQPCSARLARRLSPGESEAAHTPCSQAALRQPLPHNSLASRSSTHPPGFSSALRSWEPSAAYFTRGMSREKCASVGCADESVRRAGRAQRAPIGTFRELKRPEVERYRLARAELLHAGQEGRRREWCGVQRGRASEGSGLPDTTTIALNNSPLLEGKALAGRRHQVGMARPAAAHRLAKGGEVSSRAQIDAARAAASAAAAAAREAAVVATQ
ncbi:MAG: hypothetical protein SGPRY_010541, partial [Prymnesium sp.]